LNKALSSKLVYNCKSNEEWLEIQRESEGEEEKSFLEQRWLYWNETWI